MEIVEQLKFEVSERASSPEGLLRLIRLITSEVEKIDFSDPEAPKKYIALLRAYVLVKRQIQYFNRRCEQVEISHSLYTDTVRSLKNALSTKRREARQFATDTIPPEKLKELKRYAGTNMAFRMSEIQINPAFPRPRWYFGVGGE